METGNDESNEIMRGVSEMVLSKYWVCITCGSMTQMQRGLCDYCESPLPNFLHSPEPSLVRDGVYLGTMSDGNPFHLPPSQFGFHFAFYGVTGSGKTREAMNLAITAENSGIKLLILDVEGEWKNILPKLNSKSEYYATDRNLKINPYDLNDYGLVRALVKEIIFRGIEVEYQDLSPQMNYVLDACIRESTSIPMLIDNVVNYEERNLPFRLNNLDKTKAALLVRLEPYRSNPALSEIFYTEASSLNLERLDDTNILIDLHPLEAHVAYGTELRFIYNTIAVAYLKQALHREPTEKISNLFLADEAQLLAPKILHKLLVTDTWATTEFATRLRKRGQSLAIIAQSPSNVEDDIRKNCQNVFLFRVQDAREIDLMARSFGYTSYKTIDHFAQEVTNLRQRQAIVKVEGIEPFIVNAVETLLQSVGNEELSPFIPAHEESITELEERFMQSVTEQPFISVVERRALLGWDARTYSDIVGRLETRGLVEKVGAKLGKGAPHILYQKPNQVPSIKHQFFVHWIIEKLRDIGVECKANIVGPDIEANGVAIEVELGKSDIFGNIASDLERFRGAIVCSDSKEVIERVSREITDNRALCSRIEEVPALFSKMYLNEQNSPI